MPAILAYIKRRQENPNSSMLSYTLQCVYYTVFCIASTLILVWVLHHTCNAVSFSPSYSQLRTELVITIYCITAA